MEMIRTALQGVVIIEPEVFGDARGSFAETFSERDFAAAFGASLPRSENCPTGPVRPCGPHRFVQDNESRSRQGVVRGLHFQKDPHAQAKLVRVVQGRILDVAVDMRRTSETFGRHVAVELSGENRRQMFIPHGFAHGFAAFEEGTVVAYKVDGYYAPESEAGVLWNDPALGIDWGIDPRRAIVSSKDAALPTLANAYRFTR